MPIPERESRGRAAGAYDEERSPEGGAGAAAIHGCPGRLASGSGSDERSSSKIPMDGNFVAAPRHARATPAPGGSYFVETGV
jgi:hypothetical protein